MSTRLEDCGEFVIYKYANEEKTIAGIQTDCRFPSIDQILELVDICKRGFPGLSHEDIRIYSDFQRRNWGRDLVAEIGIEFDVPAGAYVPSDYYLINLRSVLPI